MALSQKELKRRISRRAEFFESHLSQEVDMENECQWVRTATSGKCGNQGVVYIWEVEQVFQHLEPKEHIMCKECIRHFVKGIRKRWRIKRE